MTKGKKFQSNRIKYLKPVNNSPYDLIFENIARKEKRQNKKEKTISKLNIACILDNFSFESLKYECNLIPLKINNWKEILTKEKIDFLLVESAWEGYKGQWRNEIINLENKYNKKLKSIVNLCKKQNIPTVFWNKEDPGHFYDFIDAAKIFDYIFTTDSDCVSKYKEFINHQNIYTLMFAAQPKIHNPINKDKDQLGEVAFSGSWYALKLPQRKKDLKTLLTPSLNYNLHIYDRYYNYTKTDRYKFPDIYKPFIKGYLPYEQMIETYKKYHIFLNVNSARNSPTMFSRRVFELLACGTNVLSGYSLGIKKIFPEIVKICETEKDTEKHLKDLLNNKDLRDKLSVLGQREVFNKHTYKHRLKKIASKINIDYEKEDKPKVSIITSTNRPNNIDNILKNYERQNYDMKELIIIINNNEINMLNWKERAKEYENVKIFKLDETKTLGECLNFAVEQSNFQIISKFDDDDYYAPNYLTDLVNAFNYTVAKVVGKYSSFVYFKDRNILAIRYPEKENRYLPFVTGPTLTFKREVFKNIKFSNVNKGEDTQFLKDCNLNGFKVYATDRFNHVLLRKSSIDEHTWKISDDELLKKCEIIAYTDDYKSIITI
ncbi:MAG: glycosyltransferase [Firmicutes bacterium]|nr:glycosyltransferase [Bacillota bacterium]